MPDTVVPLHSDLAAELAELGRVTIPPDSMARVWARVQGMIQSEEAPEEAPSNPTDQEG